MGGSLHDGAGASASAGSAKVVESFMKMPEPTKTASRASCITQRRVGGVAMRPAEKLGTGSLPAWPPSHQLVGARWSWRRVEFFFAHHGEELPHFADDLAHVLDGVDDVAGASFALGADHGRAFGDAPQGLAQVARPGPKGVLKRACRCDGLRRPG